MSYQVLARKWRPRTFDTMVGQSHVLKALVNALNAQRLHHAYLFTGTRGVGKTTIARIFAKCLNCESGISSTPCGECSACMEIDQGRFVDLIEVDAASRTKVEDTRELLDNVQYAPTKARYKVYLIDEVHMLSGHSFNALLKTLEEPPPHIKFILATTDPQKLPITVLSRCLQFHLKALSVKEIALHLETLLNSEQIQFEAPALRVIAKAAAGSMRDALSLLDQVIGYSNGDIKDADARTLLGCMHDEPVIRIMESLVTSDAHQVLQASRKIAEYTPDYNEVLAVLIELIQDAIIAQFSPQSLDPEEPRTERINKLAHDVSKEDLQLFYQIALLGRKDLQLAPDAQRAFDMVLLRMLAFNPVDTSSEAPAARCEVNKPNKKQATHTAPVKTNPDRLSATIPVTPSAHTGGCEQWDSLIQKLSLSGVSKLIVSNSVVQKQEDNALELAIAEQYMPMLNQRIEAQITEALSDLMGRKLKVVFNEGKVSGMTPADKQSARKQQAHDAAVERIENDPNVQALKDTFDAKVDRSSIKLS